jgi:hypothetical protein
MGDTSPSQSPKGSEFEQTLRAIIHEELSSFLSNSNISSNAHTISDKGEIIVSRRGAIISQIFEIISVVSGIVTIGEAILNPNSQIIEIVDIFAQGFMRPNIAIISLAITIVSAAAALIVNRLRRRHINQIIKTTAHAYIVTLAKENPERYQELLREIEKLVANT